MKVQSELELRLLRIAKRSKYTIGRLYVNGFWVCDTLEDTDRGLDNSMTEEEIRRRKIYGRTAIPKGTYYVSMDITSEKLRYRSWATPYKGKIPRLLSVKGFDGVLIHPGNTETDTYGCVLVGENKQVGKVLNSTATFKNLMDKYLVPAYKRGEVITITVDCLE